MNKSILETSKDEKVTEKVAKSAENKNFSCVIK